jgi:AraC-like DNA-binding protein
VALVIAIRREELLATACRLGAADPAPAALRKLELNNGPGRSFANVLGCLCAESDGARDGNAAPGIREGLQDLLLESLVRMNTEPHPPGLEHASSRRRRLGVARAVEYMQSNAHRAVSGAELASVACLSLRSLQIAFGECFGTGPMSYLRRLRLARARAELISLDPRDVQLAGFAARWGFSSPSTFTRVYRRTFNELPSQTLRTARRALRRRRGRRHQAEA